MRKNLIINFLYSLFCLLILCQACTSQKPISSTDTAIQIGPQTVKAPSGVDIHYTVHGSADHSLILVHGWSCDQTYWDEQVTHFKDDFQVITIDLGGHGMSGSNREDWTMDSFGDDVIAVVKTLNYKKLSLVGHSMGSVVVMNAASKLESPPQSVVFVDYFKNKPAPAPLSKEQVMGMSGPMATDFVNGTKGFVMSLFRPDSDAELRARIANQMSSANPDVALPAMRDMMMADVNKGFEGLLINGNKLHLINSDMRPTEADYFESKSIQVHTINETGHFLMMEKAEEFNELLSSIIAL